MTDYEKRSRELWRAIVQDVEEDAMETALGAHLTMVDGEICDSKEPFIEIDRAATPEEIEEVRPDSIKWSAGEKLVMARMHKQEPPLVDNNGKPYAIRSVTTANGHVAHIYVIPKDERVKHMQRLWPFKPVPTADEMLQDVHSNKVAPFQDCEIIRWNRFNFIVAPDYLHTGGMAVDLVTPADEEEK
jgi:hypothetical protein